MKIEGRHELVQVLGKGVVFVAGGRPPAALAPAFPRRRRSAASRARARPDYRYHGLHNRVRCPQSFPSRQLGLALRFSFGSDLIQLVSCPGNFLYFTRAAKSFSGARPWDSVGFGPWSPSTIVGYLRGTTPIADYIPESWMPFDFPKIDTF